jgi:hypothetical protein
MQPIVGCTSDRSEKMAGTKTSTPKAEGPANEPGTPKVEQAEDQTAPAETIAGSKMSAPKEAGRANKPNSSKAKQAADRTDPPETIESAAEKPRTIRSICEEGLLAGLSYDQIIAKVKAVHLHAKTTPGCISWYRTKLVKRGLLPSGKEMAAARKRAAEADVETARVGEK